MRRLVIYVHGKGGDAGEAKYYQSLFAESEVIGFDYRTQKPWQIVMELFWRCMPLWKRGLLMQCLFHPL